MDVDWQRGFRDERLPSRLSQAQILLSVLVHTIQANSLLIIVDLT